MKRSIVLTILIFVGCIACKKDKGSEIQISQQSYTIPGNTFFPEGIAYDAGKGVFYTGSVSNGDIVQVNVQTGASTQFAAGAPQGRAAATGMKLDSRGRLWICGGADNKIHVLNTDGSLLKSWNLSSFSATGFINDCVLDNNYVYFTDSQNKQIYRTSVAAAQPGDMERWLTFTDQQIPYTATGTNANGIVMTPSGNYLIVVISSSGKLYRIDISSKAIVEITLNTTVMAGDGLLLDKNILYVSRNAANQIFPVTLNSEFSQGTVGTGFGDNLLFNTTLAKAGSYFLVVNGQLNRRSGTTPPVLPFTVSRVSIP